MLARSEEKRSPCGNRTGGSDSQQPTSHPSSRRTLASHCDPSTRIWRVAHGTSGMSVLTGEVGASGAGDASAPRPLASLAVYVKQIEFLENQVRGALHTGNEGG